MNTLSHEDDLAGLAESLPNTDVTARASAMRMIKSQEEFDLASTLLLECQALLKEAQDKFREPKRKADAAHAAICQLEKDFIDPLGRARRWLTTLMSGWIQQQQEQAEEKNRQDRQAAMDREAEYIERQIEEAESRGATASEVRAILRYQPSTLPPPVTQPVATMKGISSRDEWYGEITNKRAFLQAALSDARIFEVIEVDTGKLNRLIRLLKGSLGNIPGLRVWHAPAISSSRQRGTR
jgi:hypothetical protein